MRYHILDTGAVYHLLNKHRPPLRSKLDAVPDDSVILIPALVLTEANQVKELSRKRLEGLLEIANIQTPDRRVFDRAPEGLRCIERFKCKECNSFRGPSLVDAVVMAFADRYVDTGGEAIVYTTDIDDME